MIWSFSLLLFSKEDTYVSRPPLQPICALYLDAISSDNNKTHHSAGTTQHISSHPRSGWIHPCLASETRQDWAVLELWLELLGYLSDKMKKKKTKKTFPVMLRLRERFYFSGKTMGTKDICLGKCQEMDCYWSLEKKDRNKPDRMHPNRADSWNWHPLPALLQAPNSMRQASLPLPKSYE